MDRPIPIEGGRRLPVRRGIKRHTDIHDGAWAGVLRDTDRRSSHQFEIREQTPHTLQHTPPQSPHPGHIATSGPTSVFRRRAATLLALSPTNPNPDSDPIQQATTHRDVLMKSNGSRRTADDGSRTTVEVVNASLPTAQPAQASTRRRAQRGAAVEGGFADGGEAGGEGDGVGGERGAAAEGDFAG